MLKILLAITVFVSFGVVQSCSRKTTPSKSEAAKAEEAAKTEEAAKGEAEVEKKAPVIKPIVKTAIPKMITVNDRAAKKTVSGRYYYDLEGKRYWRNNKDGKYYLYYKGMFDNKDFQ